MVDASALVVAIVSLVGTLIVASVTILFQYFSDERKRLSETEKLIRKYRDPVLWAANELQSRLYNISDLYILNTYNQPSKHDLIVAYTAYLFGQWFSWTSIFRRQAQFLGFASQAGKDQQRLNDLLAAISTTMLTSSRPLTSAPFMLWRGQQFAIGEVMTVRENGKDDKPGEWLCMGYATFAKQWYTDKHFRKWFLPIEDGLQELGESERVQEHQKLRIIHLQHLLYELLELLDPNGLQWDKKLNRCRLSEEMKEHCRCQKCKTDWAARKVPVKQAETRSSQHNDVESRGKG